MRAYDVYRTERARRVEQARAFYAGSHRNSVVEAFNSVQFGPGGGGALQRLFDKRVSDLDAEWTVGPFDASKYGTISDLKYVDAPASPKCAPTAATPVESFIANERAQVAERAVVLASEVFRELEKLKSVDAAWAFGRVLCDSVGVDPPKSKQGVRAELARMIDKKWWRLKLGRQLARSREAAKIRAYAIRSQGSLFCSELALARRIVQGKRNARLLADLVAVNELGQRYTLAELSQKSASNPDVRRGEWYCRLRGIEQKAKDRGDTAYFVTVTLPSRYHAVIEKTNQPNRSFNQSTPAEAQKVLCAQWARIRSALDKKGIKLYGVRVVEPHHDGTPHWHLCMLCSPKVWPAALEVMQGELYENGDSEDAKAARLDIDEVRRDKGGYPGIRAYLSAYISKNLDGKQLKFVEEVDADGRLSWRADGITSAERACVWASLWGIRQFQFFGLPTFGVWREFWRVREPMEYAGPLMMRAHATVLNEDYAGHIDAAGGVLCPRWLQPLRMHRPGMDQHGRYGDALDPVKGVAQVLDTRWSALACRLRRKRRKIISKRVRTVMIPAIFGVAQRTTEVQELCTTRLHQWSIEGNEGADSAPWTRVNNCTRQRDIAAFDEGARAPGCPVVPDGAGSSRHLRRCDLTDGDDDAGSYRQPWRGSTQ